jgi:hypothetical protein
MDVGQLVEELMEKRFTERAEELVGKVFVRENHGYGHNNDEYSEFDQKLRWFIDKIIDKYLEENKERIMDIVLKQIDLDKISLRNCSIGAKMEE